jgi:hypothetical protein
VQGCQPLPAKARQGGSYAATLPKKGAIPPCLHGAARLLLGLQSKATLPHPACKVGQGCYQACKVPGCHPACIVRQGRYQAYKACHLASKRAIAAAPACIVGQGRRLAYTKAAKRGKAATRPTQWARLPLGLQKRQRRRPACKVGQGSHQAYTVGKVAALACIRAIAAALRAKWAKAATLRTRPLPRNRPQKAHAAP